MTDIDTWPLWLAICFLAGPIVLGFVSVAYSQYLRYWHLDAMIEALKNSRYIYIWGPSLRKQGVIGTSLMIAKLSQMILMPRSSLKTGELDLSDLENFPPYLRRLLRVDQVILIVGCIWLVISCVLVKFG